MKALLPRCIVNRIEACLKALKYVPRILYVACCRALRRAIDFSLWVHNLEKDLMAMSALFPIMKPSSCMKDNCFVSQLCKTLHRAKVHI